MSKNLGLFLDTYSRKYKKILKLIFFIFLGLILTLTILFFADEDFNKPAFSLTSTCLNLDKLTCSTYQQNNLTKNNKSLQVNNEQNQINELVENGKIAYQNGRYTQASNLWQQALDYNNITLIDQALILNYLSLAYQKLDQWQKAEIAINQSLNILQQFPLNSPERLEISARSLTTLAHYQLIQGQSLEALENTKKATEIYQTLGDIFGELGSLINQAQILQNLGHYRDTLNLFEDIKKLIQNNQQQINSQEQEQRNYISAINSLSLGNAYQGIGDLTKSWCVLKQGLEIPVYPQIKAELLLSLGNSLQALGKRKQASIFPSEISDSNVKSITFNCDEDNDHDFDILSVYEEALINYQEAVNLTSSPLTKNQAKLNYLSLILTWQNVKVWQEKLPQQWYSKLDQSQGLLVEIWQEIIQLEPSRQGIYLKINLAENALKLQQWLKQENNRQLNQDFINWLKNDNLENNNQLNQKFTNLLTNNAIENVTIEYQNQFLTGFPKKIANLLTSALNEAKQLKDRRVESYVLGHLGYLYQQIAQENKTYLKDAKILTENALSLSQSLINAPEIDYQWQWQLATILRQENPYNQDKIIETYTTAINSLQKVRQNVVAIDFDLDGINSDFQFYFREKVEPVYQEFIDFLLHNDQENNSFNQDNLDNSNHFKPTNLLTLGNSNFNSNKINQNNLINNNLHLAQHNIIKALAVFELFQEAELETFIQCNYIPSNTEISQDLRPKLIKQAEQELEEKLTLISQQFPETAVFYALKIKDKIETIVALPENNNFQLTQITFDLTTLNTEFSTLLNRLKIRLENPDNNRYQQSLEEFYNILIKNHEIKLKQAKNILFILDVNLRNIPMSALYNTQENSYLIDDYNIALNHSLLLTNLEPFKRKNLYLLLAGITQPIDGNPALLKVKDELEQIKNSGIVEGKILLDEEFTQANFQSTLASFPINSIHIATHGKFGSNRQNSYLLTYDQRIYIHNLNDFLKKETNLPNYKFDLLTLSACETAKGDNYAILGLAGIAVKSKARSILATLWKIPDQETAEIMIDFYQKLTNPDISQMSKSKALRQAQLKMKATHPHPYYWASYVMIGNWQ